MEGPVPVIGTGGQEVREDVVAVGGADQLAHRQAHLAGVPTGQDVAEVPGGHAVVDLLPHLDLPLVE